MSDARPERRLAAIISADVVGYSRLIAVDEDGTVERLSAYRAQIGILIEQHRGRLADFTGDNFLAEFPTALEAVQCAVQIQQVIDGLNVAVPQDRKLLFRIGAHLGDIREEDGRVYGEGINIAARLESLAPAGGICMSESVYSQVRHRVDVHFEDAGPQELKNILQPVRTYLVRFDDAAVTDIRKPPPRPAYVMGPLIGALILLIAAYFLVRDRGSSPPPLSTAPVAQDVGPNIAVLPFENHSADPDQAYFADGMTEDLTTDLTQVPGLAVIASRSAFQFRDSELSVPEIAAELGVRFLITGGVRRDQQKIRISAQLVNGTTGTQVWSETFDRDLTDIFALQDDVTGRIVHALRAHFELGPHTAAEAPPTPNREAYDKYLRGRAHLAYRSRNDVYRARELFQEAIDLDPDFGLAYTEQALTYFVEFVSQWTDDDSVIENGIELGERGVELAPTSARAHRNLARVYTYAGQHDEAVREATRAMELAPNDATVAATYGEVLTWAGRATEGLAYLRDAQKRSPRDPFINFQLGIAFNILERHQEAIRELETAVNHVPDLYGAHFTLAVAYHEAGQHDRAQAAIAEVLRLSPDYTLQRLRLNASSANPRFRTRTVAALRSLGIPEGTDTSGAGDETSATPAIAVLPFANISGDPEQEYFVDGMTEDLITDLAKLSGVLVIARNSVFVYKGQAVNVQEVARKLNVQYVVEGSVRKAGNRVRINAQLIDGHTGHHLWSERYDRELTDIFAVQDDVTQAIVSALEVTLTGDEQTRLSRVPTENPEAYDAYLRWITAARLSTPEGHETARALLERAVALDPEFADAHALLAANDLEAWLNQWSQDAASLQRARRRATHAVALDPDNGTAQVILAVIAAGSRDFAQALPAADRALSLEPHRPIVLQWAASVLTWAGQPERALQVLELLERLNPLERVRLGYEFGITYLALGRNEEAIERLEQTAAAYPGVVRMHIVLARAYVELGDLPRARAQAQEVLRVSPDYTIARQAVRLPYADPALRARVLEAYRQAGIPEGNAVEAAPVSTPAPE